MMREESIVARTPNRRDMLLAAALDGFATRGYEATTVAELAAATGMNKAAVSYHFRTKNDLLHALAEPLLDRLDARARLDGVGAGSVLAGDEDGGGAGGDGECAGGGVEGGGADDGVGAGGLDGVEDVVLAGEGGDRLGGGVWGGVEDDD
jgi:AcrR family transcriptional regulator